MKVVYDPALSCDGGRGGFRVLYPVRDGFLEYNFVHSVSAEKNCDLWRMSVVNGLDESGAFCRRLTKGGAEWEMALRLKGRPDFIGGFNHGDEVGREPVFFLDGALLFPEALTEARDCSKLEISVESVGFDPADPSVALLSHRKHYLFDSSGVEVEQEVLWKRDVVLDGKFKSYFAMMPPLKHAPKQEEETVTHSYSFGEEKTALITRLPVEAGGVSRITVEGDSYRFTMSAADYQPRYDNGYFALLTDNGNLNYHKMYLAFAGGKEETVSAGTRWRAKTHYRIEKK